MTAWTSDELSRIGEADELDIASVRRDGTLRNPVTIWVVRHGDDLYVRSVNGRTGAWFRLAQDRHEAHIQAGDVEKDVLLVETDDVNDEIDAAYRAKYRRYAARIVDTVVTPEARAAAQTRSALLRRHQGRMMDQPIAEEALEKLATLVGEWTLEAMSADGEPWPGGGRAIFDWHDSRAHLIERWTVDLPEAPDGVSIMGCDGANGTFFQLYSDERGVCRIYEMSIGEGEWKLWREGEPFPQRFTGTFSEDGNTISGRWEKAEDGTHHTTDFFLTYRRVDPLPP